MRHVEGVFPDGGLVRFGRRALQTAGSAAGVYIRASERVLIAPSLVEMFGLEEACEACITTVVEELRCFILAVEIYPIIACGLVLFDIGLVAETGGYEGDAIVVIGIFKST